MGLFPVLASARVLISRRPWSSLPLTQEERRGAPVSLGLVTAVRRALCSPPRHFKRESPSCELTATILPPISMRPAVAALGVTATLDDGVSGVMNSNVIRASASQSGSGAHDSPCRRLGRALACGTSAWALVACLFLAAAIVTACSDSTPRPSGSVSSGSGDAVAAVLCDQAPRALAMAQHLEAARDALARLDEPTLIVESGEAARIALTIQEELMGLEGDATSRTSE